MSRELLINPYDIKWDEVEPYKGNFHQHSTESDGRQSVAILIDQAKDLGMDMFVVSDHDTERPNRGRYPKVTDVPTPERPTGKYRNTWPLSKFDHDIYYDPNNQRNYTELARRGTPGEFNVDGNGVMQGMLTFEACEFTEKHHIISMMSNADGFPGNYEEDFVLSQAQDRNGITYLAHPGRHWDYDKKYSPNEKYSPQWYEEILSEFDSCLGLEVDNLDNKYIHDRELWDMVNSLGLHPTPIWGFSGTDSHGDYSTLNYNVVFMKDFNVSELKQRLINGNFYSIRGQYPPIIEKIGVDEPSHKIRVTTKLKTDLVTWISCGKVVHVGNTLDYSKVVGLSKYVRAYVLGRGGVAYTNPFYFNRFVKPKFV